MALRAAASHMFAARSPISVPVLDRLGRVDPLYVGVGLAAAVFALVAAFTHPNRRAILSFALGVTAGLVAVQIFRIHAFTIMAVIYALLPESPRNRLSLKYVAVMLISALLLASTVLLGELVNSATLGLQLLGLAASAAIVAWRARPQDATAMVWGLLVVSTFGSAVGVLQVFRIIPMDLWHLDVSAIGRPTGIYPEPDWLGMFSGVGLILGWRLSMPRAAKVGFVLTNLMVFVLAMARAAWVALAASLLLLWIVSVVSNRKRSHPESEGKARRGRLAAVVVTITVSVVALSAVPQLQQDLSVRLSSMTGTVQEDDISGQARIRQNDSLMVLARTVPLYGHGLSAAGRVGVWGQIDTVGESGNNVASNWIIGMWVDGAFFAVPLILFLICLALARLRTPAGHLLLFCLISSLFSNAVFFPVTWILVGLAIIAQRGAQLAGQPEASMQEFSPAQPFPAPSLMRSALGIVRESAQQAAFLASPRLQLKHPKHRLGQPFLNRVADLLHH
jgi:hypothetical protein